MAACRSHCPTLPLERACQLLGMSRASYYRRGQEPVTDPEAERLRDALEALVLAWPRYGYRRLTHLLRREGWTVNAKRVLRLLRLEGWLCPLPRRWVRTTDSAHGLQVYPNLLPDCGWRRLTGVNQAWVAEIV